MIVDADTVNGTRWDVIVIGAGPAGALAAHLTSHAGLRVLLVDSKPFPRDKVCGGCVNARALAVLEAAGLGAIRHRLAAVPLDTIEFRHRRQRVEIAAPGGIAISRSVLDMALVNAAVDVGATFLPGTEATLIGVSQAISSCSERRVCLQGDRWSETVAAQGVVIADGLNRRSLREVKEEFPEQIDSHSWIGLGGRFPADADDLPSGRLRMAIGTAGYVGMVRVEKGDLNVAAAVSTEFLRENHTPGDAVARLLNSAGLGLAEIAGSQTWIGTGALTRRSLRVAGTRVWLVGDATGYVEPFTGEGIAWALNSAHEVAPLVIRGVRSWSPQLPAAWTEKLRRSVRRQQFWCRGLASVLRRPWLVQSCLAVAGRIPALPRYIASQINRPVCR